MNRVTKRKKRRVSDNDPAPAKEANKAESDTKKPENAGEIGPPAFAVEAPVAPKHQAQTEQPQSRRRHILDFLKYPVSLISLIVSALAATYTYKQAEIAEKALVAGQQAYVYLKAIDAKWLDTKTADPGMVVNITFKIENSGNTPTRDLRIVAGCYPLGPEFPREPFIAFKWDEKRMAHLFIGAHQTLDYPGCRVPEREIDAMQSSPFVERFLMGEIRYFDTISDPPVEHVTQFAYQLAVHSFDAKAQLLDYETLLTGNHNCSDDECKNAKGDPGPLAAPRWHTY